MALGAVLAIGQGLFGAASKYGQSKQVRYNARVAAQDMENRKIAMINARIANSQIEARISETRIGNLENSYAVSGVEMSGDIANYVAEAAAIEELNTQQLNQDAFYQARVMDVQRENMRLEAKQTEKALKIGAFASLIGGGFDAATVYSENSNFWETQDKKKIKTLDLSKGRP